MKSMKPKSKRRTQSNRRVRSAVVRTWLATDENIIMVGKVATCLFFGSKPVLVMGWWQQPGKPNGRWPVPNIVKQKRGEICEVTICPND